MITENVILPRNRQTTGPLYGLMDLCSVPELLQDLSLGTSLGWLCLGVERKNG